MKKPTKLILGLVLVCVLALGWWLVSPLLFNDAVDEALPPSSSDVKTKEQKPDTEEPDSDETETATPDPSEQNEVNLSGVFTDGEKNYKTSGTLKTIQTNDGRYIRFEDFKTTNGPDLFVYLIQSGTEPKDGISLGALKGNVGNQNYSVPKDVDFSKYDTVLIWCRAFNADFGFASLKASNE